MRDPLPHNTGHGVKYKKLNRPTDQRKAMLRGLTTELIRHGRVKTTLVRCKALRKTADHMVQLAKGAPLAIARCPLLYPSRPSAMPPMTD